MRADEFEQVVLFSEPPVEPEFVFRIQVRHPNSGVLATPCQLFEWLTHDTDALI